MSNTACVPTMMTNAAMLLVETHNMFTQWQSSHLVSQGVHRWLHRSTPARNAAITRPPQSLLLHAGKVPASGDLIPVPLFAPIETTS